VNPALRPATAGSAPLHFLLFQILTDSLPAAAAVAILFAQNFPLSLFPPPPPSPFHAQHTPLLFVLYHHQQKFEAALRVSVWVNCLASCQRYRRRRSSSSTIHSCSAAAGRGQCACSWRSQCSMITCLIGAGGGGSKRFCVCWPLIAQIKRQQQQLRLQER
jgi:hypothetical protein